MSADSNSNDSQLQSLADECSQESKPPLTSETECEIRPNIPPPPPPPPPPADFVVGIHQNSGIATSLPHTETQSVIVPPAPPPPPPPPPLPGCLLSFPPIAGGGPPPPPPPPPPLPGCLSLSSGGPPPPPPLPGSGPPPPPPPPALGTANAGFSSGGTCQQLNSVVCPAPLPAPPVGGWSTVYNRARKKAVTPKAPMKPLYWTRIQVVNDEIRQQEAEKENNVWEKLDEENPENLEEFINLFSRQVVKPKKDDKPKNSKSGNKGKVVNTANILDSKRAHTVNIFITSRRLEISEIENAVYNFDTSIVGTETLQQIFEIYASNEELSQIKNHLKANPNIPLGKPEQFLYDLSLIPFFADRVACIMFEIQFCETLSNIETRLNNFKMICDTLRKGQGIKDLFAIILALGNYMNGGNRDRGQADGFGLEILPKLKDVKSSIEASMTLLHYVVKVYVDKHISIDEVTRDINNAKLPVPEPQNLERASLVIFDDVSTELKKLLSQTNGIELKVNRVLESCTENSNSHEEPFKSRMQRFLEKAYESLKEQEDNLSECIKKFPEMIAFFKWRPKSSNQADACKEFFAIWLPFSSDFKDIFMKEIHRRIKLDVEKAKEKVKEQKSKKVPQATRKSEPGGLKSKLKNQGLIYKN